MIPKEGRPVRPDTQSQPGRKPGGARLVRIAVVS